MAPPPDMPQTDMTTHALICKEILNVWSVDGDWPSPSEASPWIKTIEPVARERLDPTAI